MQLAHGTVSSDNQKYTLRSQVILLELDYIIGGRFDQTTSYSDRVLVTAPEDATIACRNPSLPRGGLA